MIKTNIQTTYKNIPTDIKAQEDYLDYAGKGEKRYTENELKWFRTFHNKNSNDILESNIWEWETYTKMLSYLAFGKEFNLEFDYTSKKPRAQGAYVHLASKRVRVGVKIEFNPLTILSSGESGRGSIHQLATSVIRHELCHWYLHTTGSNEFSDGQREFESLLFKVDADSTMTSSVEESKRIQKAHVNGTFKRTTLHYDITMKKVPLSKTQINEDIFETAYEVKDINTEEHISYIAKAKNGLFIPISNEYEQSYTSRFGEESYSDIANAKRGFRQRKDALSSLMNLTGR